MSETKSEHRKYIHDFANHLTIIDGGLYKVMSALSEKGQEQTEEYQRLVKVAETVKSSIAALKNYRQYVHALEAKT